MKDYFKILELASTASADEVKKAYRRLAKRYHPDRNSSPDAQQKFIEINEAYEFLLDDRRRTFYQQRQRQRVSPEEQARREATYQEWVRRQQKTARTRAEANAHASFEKFMKSPIYKTAIVMSRVYNYIFLGLGMVMVFTPILLLIRDGDRLIKDEVSVGFVLLPGIIGAAFTYGIYYYLFKNQEV